VAAGAGVDGFAGVAAATGAAFVAAGVAALAGAGAAAAATISTASALIWKTPLEPSANWTMITAFSPVRFKTCTNWSALSWIS